MKANRMSALVTLLVVACSGLAYGQTHRSSDVADRLLKVLRERRIQHLAAKDLAETGRYVAATLIGDSSLLLVSARYEQPVTV